MVANRAMAADGRAGGLADDRLADGPATAGLLGRRGHRAPASTTGTDRRAAGGSVEEEGGGALGRMGHGDSGPVSINTMGLVDIILPVRIHVNNPGPPGRSGTGHGRDTAV